MTRSTILLDASAAGSCPVKTQNAYLPGCPPPAQPVPAQAELAVAYPAQADPAEVLQRLVAQTEGRLVDLRTPTDRQPEDRIAACREAMRSGADVVLGGWLPVDASGHRRGQPDLLVRGIDRQDGTPRYHPVQVKRHRIVERRHPADPRFSNDLPAVLSYTTLTHPRPVSPERLEGYALRSSRREPDLLELAHFHRMLEAAGFAAGDDARGAVIGTDDVLGQTVLAWADLTDPLVRTFSRSDSRGWRLRSLLERYDHEQAFRLDIADVAAVQHGSTADLPLLVRPVVTRECSRCVWWPRCRPQLDPDDVSLRIDKGALDVREVLALRSQGVHTVAELAGADQASLLAGYLPEVTHRRDAETRIQVATRRARMLLDGRWLERETAGAIEVPAAEVEIDFDIETSAGGRIYLWGFLVPAPDPDQRATYRAFSRFEDLDADGEAELAREAFGWLRDQVGGGRSVRVYHYSGYELAAIEALAARLDDPLFDWALAYAREQFVDLLELVQTHFFGVAGLGLKVVAQHGAGFGWRDQDPGGLNSQLWFSDAVHAASEPDRAAARQRVLDYNEDDVAATARVRAWLRMS